MGVGKPEPCCKMVDERRKFPPSCDHKFFSIIFGDSLEDDIFEVDIVINECEIDADLDKHAKGFAEV